MDEINLLAEWLRLGKRVALATVVNTWGSSPRPVGSHLIVDDSGQFSGSVSGGCIEGAVVTEAMEVIHGAEPRLVKFGVSDDQAWEVGLSCGGAIQIYIQSVEEKNFENLFTDCSNNNPVAMVTRINDGAMALIHDQDSGHSLATEFGLSITLCDEARSLLRSGRSSLLRQSNETFFVRSYVPPARLILVGAVHIASILIPMAQIAGYEVTLVDPRTAFGHRDRFPDVTLINEWPDQALEELAIDRRTAIVTLSHDPKIDDPALTVALNSPAFYIGALGSYQTHSQRMERLKDLGFDDREIARIHAPIGIKLGGRLPAEIAVSILAQIIQTRHSAAIAKKTGTTGLK